MPSRNNREKFCDAASRSPNETGCSLSINRSDMSAPHNGKSMPLRGARVQQRWQNLCEMVCGTLPPPTSPACGEAGRGSKHQKKSRHPGRLQVITGGRQNRVDRSHSVSAEWTFNEWNEKS